MAKISLQEHSRKVIFLMIFLVLLGGYGASKSRVDNSLEVWQSHDDAGWLAYQDFREKSQLSDPLIVFIPGTLDPFAVEDLSDAISVLDTVRTCRDLQLTTADNTTATLLTITPMVNATPPQLATLLEQVQAILKAQEVQPFHLGGVWYLTHELDTLSAQSTTILFPVVILVTALIIVMICRGQALLILACGLIPALLLVGLMGFFSVKMNMVLLALPPLTLILGLAHGIHFSIKKWGPNDTSMTVFNRVAPPCLISGLTTSLGFGSLLLSSYQPVRELGVWGGIGCLLSLSVTFILVPPFLRPGGRQFFSLPDDFSEKLKRRRTLIATSLITLMLLGGIGLNRLQTGSMILDFFEPDSQVCRDYRYIEAKGIGLTPMEINLYGSHLTRPMLRQPLQQLATLHPEITHFIFTMTDATTQIKNTGATFRAPEMSTPKLTVERITILLTTISSEDTLRVAQASEDLLQTELGPRDLPYLTGSVPLYAAGQQTLFNSMLKSFSLAFIAISLVIGLMLRSLRMAFIAMLPNLLPVVLVVAIMGWLGIPLSVATMTVASIIFGIVVDDTIHYLYTYQKSKLSGHARLNHVFSQVGSPIITTTLVTGTGFLAFKASPFIPLGHFGLLISLALWMALACDLLILPLLLMDKNNV